jgi:hypothetical protein
VSEISPPFVDGVGPAPRAVCARWLGTAPCGAYATWHVIWDGAMQNGPVCEEHMAEARQRWVFLDAHPYSPVCGRPGSLWDSALGACFMPGEATGAEQILAAGEFPSFSDLVSKDVMDQNAITGTGSRVDCEGCGEGDAVARLALEDGPALLCDFCLLNAITVGAVECPPGFPAGDLERIGDLWGGQHQHHLTQADRQLLWTLLDALLDTAEALAAAGQAAAAGGAR